jgi:phosphatidylglycerol:prolipoprotein diacylglycerol transferase
MALVTSEGGGAFYGAVLAVIPLYAVYCRKHAIPYWAALDVAALVLPLGQSIGRWGCLAAGCCHGVATDLPWAIRIDSGAVEPTLRGAPVHPTQLYEAAAQLVVFAILSRRMEKRAFDGQIAALYALMYAPIRFAIEMVRGDSVRGFWFSGLLTTSQVVSLGLFVAALILYPRLEKRGQLFRPRDETNPSMKLAASEATP